MAAKVNVAVNMKDEVDNATRISADGMDLDEIEQVKNEVKMKQEMLTPPNTRSSKRNAQKLKNRSTNNGTDSNQTSPNDENRKEKTKLRRSRSPSGV